MSQTSPRRKSVVSSQIHDMTLEEIEKELSDVYGVRAPDMNRGHLATVLAEHREDSASQLHEGSSPISNPDDMTSEAIMHELFYVYGNYAPDLNRDELTKLLLDYREGLIPAFSFPDPSATLNLDGNSQTWLAGNGVFANIAIPSVGNIATLNLDGNASNVLRGDGTFGADANSSYGDSNVTSLLGAFGSNTISTTGNITGNTNGFTIGYLNIPQVAAANATLALTDAGKHYYSTTAGNFTLTIPTNANVAFATGTAVSIVVQAAGNILVNAASGVTLYMAGNSTAANRAVGGYGMATLMKVGTDTWFINGTGVV